MHVGDVEVVDGKHEEDIEGEGGTSEGGHGCDCMLDSCGVGEEVGGECGGDDVSPEEAWRPADL